MMRLPMIDALAPYEAFWLRVVVYGLSVLAGLCAGCLLLLRFWIVPALVRALKP